MTQTELYKHRRCLKAGNLRFRMKRNCTICVAKTKALISFAVTAKLICAFVFAYAKCWFPHDTAQLNFCSSPSHIQDSPRHQPIGSDELTDSGIQVSSCRNIILLMLNHNALNMSLCKRKQFGFAPGLTQNSWNLYMHS